MDRKENKIEITTIETEESVDVSEPQELPTEAELLKEQRSMMRSMWIREHLTLIFLVVGIVLVAAVILGVYLYNETTNPMNRFVTASAKNFDAPFDFSVTLTKNDKTVMQYDGSIDVDRGAHTVEALYHAQYSEYDYTGAARTVGQKTYKGVLYEDQWTVEDDTERALDFFDFDTDYKNGRFDGGAFLRFTGLTSEYSAAELESFVTKFKDKIATDSMVAGVITAKTEDGTSYEFDINPRAALEMVVLDGAPLFYRASDYDKFLAAYEANKNHLSSDVCDMSYVIRSDGYLGDFNLKVTTNGTTYIMNCHMDNFGSASPELPDAFSEALTAFTASAEE